MLTQYIKQFRYDVSSEKMPASIESSIESAIGWKRESRDTSDCRCDG